MERIAKFFEWLAQTVQPLRHLITVLAIGASVAFVYFLNSEDKAVPFFLFSAMLWLFGFLFVYLFYFPLEKGYVKGYECKMSRFRKSGNFSQKYYSLFFIYWFAFLSFSTVLLVYKAAS